VERYRGAGNLSGWDVWNELRWNVNADGLVCYCPQTIKRFRAWLDEAYGGLDGLNEAWQRRYGAWDEVQPGKAARSPYTEMMAFQRFITWRSCRHAVDRYETVKALDPDRPVTVHGGQPSVLHGDGGNNTSLHRGNDWVFADHVDGIGTSSFPNWGHMDDTDYFTRIDCTASAAQGKRIWLSEVQGGRAATGFTTHLPVRAAQQQKWLWGGISRHAEKILFWCWRDEVFGSESSGFGITGADGYAEERTAALRKTREVLGRHGELLADFTPDQQEVGVLFNPESYYLHWNQEGRGASAQNSVMGYTRALSRLNIPYSIIESEHLQALDGIRILFLPRATVLASPLIDKLTGFVRAGGTIVCESECGAFSPEGLYRYPEDRFTTELTGYAEIGRRQLEGDTLDAEVAGQALGLAVTQWLTPMSGSGGQSLARNKDGELVVRCPVDEGRVVLCASYLGEPYFGLRDAEDEPLRNAFEAFILHLCDEAGVAPIAEASDGSAGAVHVTAGRAAGRRVAFVFATEPGSPVSLLMPADTFGGTPTDLMSGVQTEVSESDGGQQVEVPATEWGVAVLCEEA
jgi:beta-galactosidase